MNYLALDTSNKNLTVVIEYDGKREIYFDPEARTEHSVAVMNKIEECAEKISADFKKMDFFAVVTGAGSFTGIRIGVSTIKAMCFAFNKPCLNITSFDEIAYNNLSGKVMAVIDALHNSVYVCGYDQGKVVFPPRFISVTELSELGKEYTLLSFQNIAGVNSRIVPIDEGLIKAVRALKENATFDYDKIFPLYVRKSQAEEGR